MINHFQQQPASNLVRPATNIIYVQGETGAKAYPVTNGYTMLLMDSEELKFYIKQTDSMGLPSMKTFKFEEVVEPMPEKPEYITKADFEDFENRIISLLQLPKEPKTTKTKGGEIDG